MSADFILITSDDSGRPFEIYDHGYDWIFSSLELNDFRSLNRMWALSILVANQTGNSKSHTNQKQNLNELTFLVDTFLTNLINYISLITYSRWYYHLFVEMRAIYFNVNFNDAMWNEQHSSAKAINKHTPTNTIDIQNGSQSVLIISCL